MIWLLMEFFPLKWLKRYKLDHLSKVWLDWSQPFEMQILMFKFYSLLPVNQVDWPPIRPLVK